MIDPLQYSNVFVYVIMILTFCYSGMIAGKSALEIKEGDNSLVPAFILTLILILWIGFRPVHWIFGDTFNYALTFNITKEHLVPPSTDEGEYLWQLLTYYCAKNLDVNSYFAIVAAGYYGFTLLGCCLLFPRNVMISLLFVLGSFSFYSYGVNGLRNGLASSIILATLGFLVGDKKNYILAGILGFIAFNIHRSTAVPLLMLGISWKFIKSFHWAYSFWLVSVVLSLVAGGFFMNLFSTLGFDGRESYISNGVDAGIFRYSGFRWDFLIYSMMPIVLGYYVIIKQGIKDRAYFLLLNTYTLTNAFWVMVIRANYSNRFAYLSWFMYPIVLAYPLLKMNVWGDEQGKNLQKIMLAQIAFTWLMNVVLA